MRAGRFPARTEDVRADAIRELRWAMAGAGLTVDKLSMMSAVVELPAVARAVAGAPPPDRPAIVMRVLTSAVDGLGDGLHARVLRNSLGLGYVGAAKDLTARRVEFVTSHNAAAREERSRNLLGETTRAVYEIEQQMLGALVTSLGALPDGQPLSSVVVPEQDVPWISVDQDITFRLGGRCGVEAEVVHIVRALVDGVSEQKVSYFCGSEQEGGRARLRVLEGGTLEDDRVVGRPNFRTARIRYPSPLAAGDTWRVRYDTLYPPTPDPDPFFMLAVVRPTEHATIRVTFDLAALPARVWRADGLVVGAGGGDPDEAEPLVPDVTGHVSAEFTAPRLGLAYGVAWEWAD